MTSMSMQVHIAYLPGKHNVSSEQIKALVKTCSRRLQIQERLTQEIADGVDSLTGSTLQCCYVFFYSPNLPVAALHVHTDPVAEPSSVLRPLHFMSIMPHEWATTCR